MALWDTWTNKRPIALIDTAGGFGPKGITSTNPSACPLNRVLKAAGLLQG
jgi:hypothetical protein